MIYNKKANCQKNVFLQKICTSFPIFTEIGPISGSKFCKSIRLLKLKGDQLEKLNEKCKEREKIMELQEENKKLLEKSKSSNIEKKGELECDETLEEDVKKKNKHQKSKIKKSSKSIHHAAAGSDSQGKTDREVQLEGLVEQMNLMLVKTEQRTVKYKNDSQLLQILVAGMANYLSVPQAKSERLELPRHLVQSFPPGTPGDGKLTSSSGYLG